MNSLLVVMIVGFGIATAIALVRGLKAFWADSEHIRGNGHARAEAYGVKQNRMMAQRVLFQGISILLLVLFGAMVAHH